jgi:hypothetical protein
VPVIIVVRQVLASEHELESISGTTRRRGDCAAPEATSTISDAVACLRLLGQIENWLFWLDRRRSFFLRTTLHAAGIR